MELKIKSNNRCEGVVSYGKHCAPCNSFRRYVSKRVRDRDKRPIKDHAKENHRFLVYERMVTKIKLMAFNRRKKLGIERYCKSKIKVCIKIQNKSIISYVIWLLF